MTITSGSTAAAIRAGCRPTRSISTRASSTVCDVYDALISKRVYRGAWSHDEAMALLRRETGYALDERCVAALEQVIAREARRIARSSVAVVRPQTA